MNGISSRLLFMQGRTAVFKSSTDPSYATRRAERVRVVREGGEGGGARKSD